MGVGYARVLGLAMIGYKLQLVTIEPVEFENQPFEVQDCRLITDHVTARKCKHCDLYMSCPKIFVNTDTDSSESIQPIVAYIVQIMLHTQSRISASDSRHSNKIIRADEKNA